MHPGDPGHGWKAPQGWGHSALGGIVHSAQASGCLMEQSFIFYWKVLLYGSRGLTKKKSFYCRDLIWNTLHLYTWTKWNFTEAAPNTKWNWLKICHVHVWLFGCHGHELEVKDDKWWSAWTNNCLCLIFSHINLLQTRVSRMVTLVSLWDPFNSNIYTNGILEAMFNSVVSCNCKMENWIPIFIFIHYQYHPNQGLEQEFDT